MNKSDLVKSIIENVHLERKNRERQQYLFPELNYDLLRRKRAEGIVNSLIEIIKKSLEKGDYVFIPGFGRFKVNFKWARRGRNPKTGKSIFINSRRVVKFKSFRRLREKINSKGQGA